MKFTERVQRIFRHAENEANRTTNMVHPVHLLLGVLQEGTGVCAELCMYYPKLKDILNERLAETYVKHDEQGIRHEPFTVDVSSFTKQAVEIATRRMQHFKQVYINEGHVVDAIFRLDDPLSKKIFSGLDVSRILEIAAFPRDMIVSLKDYTFPKLPTSHLTCRRAEQHDKERLFAFVAKEFGNEWLDSLENGFLKNMYCCQLDQGRWNW